MAEWTEATSLRIMISDDDTYDRRPLYEAIVRAAREAKLAGVTVMRGITGYGGSGHVHETWRGFSYDLPIVVEIVDTDAKIDAWLPILGRLNAGVHVIRQRVQILKPSAAGKAPAA